MGLPGSVFDSQGVCKAAYAARTANGRPYEVQPRFAAACAARDCRSRKERFV